MQLKGTMTKASPKANNNNKPKKKTKKTHENYVQSLLTKRKLLKAMN